MSFHALPLRIYYEDTDAGGIVYYANYLRFAERGRTELLRSLGFENTAIRDKYGVLFVVKTLESDYRKPAYLDDACELRTGVREMGNTSAKMVQNLFRNDDLICAMNVTLVCVNTAGRPVRWPDDLKTALTTYLIT